MRGSVHRVLLANGDGIGPEIVPAAVAVLEATGVRFDWRAVNIGLGGSLIDSKIIDDFEHTKVLFKGPLTVASGSGGVTVGGRTFSSGNQVFRKLLQLYGNVRPIKSWPGVSNPHYADTHIDWVVFRENTEDVYTGEEAWVDDDTVEGIKRTTRSACTRISKMAIEYALENNRKTITCLHKANVSKKGDGLFLQTFRDVAEQMGVTSMANDQLADSFLCNAVLDPSKFDVLVCPNLFGDLVSDMGGGLIGSLGLCGSANIGQQHALFEPAHGSAPDIAGQNKASPISQILSGIAMLRYLNEQPAAAKLENAIARVVGSVKTPDLGGSASTTDVVQAIIGELQ